MTIETLSGYGRARPTGVLTWPETNAKLVAAVAGAGAQGIPRLLVDLQGLTMTSRPSIADGYALGNELARVGAQLRRLAIVAPAPILRDLDFPMVVMVNRGLNGAAFATQTEALAWLLEP